MSRRKAKRKYSAVAGALLSAAAPAAQPATAQTAIAPGASNSCAVARDGSLYTIRITNLSGITILAPDRTNGELGSVGNAQARGLVSILGDYNTCYGTDDGGGGDVPPPPPGDNQDHGGDDGGGN